MVLKNRHVGKNPAEVSAVTLLTAHLIFPFPVTLHASKSVTYDQMKSKVLFLWCKKFNKCMQKTGGNSEALIFNYIS